MEEREKNQLVNLKFKVALDSVPHTPAPPLPTHHCHKVAKNRGRFCYFLMYWENMPTEYQVLWLLPLNECLYEVYIFRFYHSLSFFFSC